MAGAWIGGLLVRRHGSRAVVSASWVAVGLVLVGPGRAGSWATLAGTALVLGLAIGVLDVSMNGAGVQLEHAAAEPLLNGLHARWSAGVLLGAGLGSLAVAADVGPAPHLAAVGVVVVVGGLVARAHLPDGRIATPGLADGPDDAQDADPAAPAGAAGGHTVATGRGRPGLRLAALAAIGGFVFLGEGALLDWSGVLVREDLDGGALLGALAVTGLSAGGLVGRLVGDGLSTRWGGPTLVRRGAVLAAVALAAVLLTPWPAVVPLLLAGVGAGVAPVVPLAFAAAGHRWGEHGIAVVTTAGYGCYLAAPAVVGAIAHASTLRIALLVPLALIAGVFPLAWSTREGR